MRKLRRYSSHKKVNKFLLDDLNDIALELEDIGLIVHIRKGSPYKGSTLPDIMVRIYGKYHFLDGGIIDTLFRMIDYMEQNDYSLDFAYPGFGDKRQVIKLRGRNDFINKTPDDLKEYGENLLKYKDALSHLYFNELKLIFKDKK